MAIATNASSLTSSGGYSNSLTISHTVAGSNTLLLVGVHCRSAVADVTGVTFNGTAMTLLGSNENTGIVGVQWYRLTAPAAGTHDVVVSLGGYRLFSVVVLSLTGVDQTTPVEASDFSTANLDGYGPGLSTTITTLTNGARIVTIAATKDDAAGFTAGSGATVLQQADDADGSLGGTALQIKDVATAGSTAYALDWVTSTNWRGATLVVKPAAGATNYTLTAAAGSFALTGQAANLLYGRYLAGAAGSFALTGVAANLLYGRALQGGVGAFALTGVGANLLYGRKLVAAAGAFTLTGVAAGTLYSRILVANTVSYTLTGVDAALNKGRTMVADAGSFALTGVAANLLKASVLTANTGAYTWTGVAAALSKSGSYSMVADVGNFALTGVAANLLYARRLVAGVGTFVLTGFTAGGGKGYILSAAAGSFALTGVAAGLSRVFSMVAGTGNFSLTGYSAVLTAPTWTPVAPISGTWTVDPGSSDTWTPVTPSSGVWN